MIFKKHDTKHRNATLAKGSSLEKAGSKFWIGTTLKYFYNNST